jgi:hypothetical protein
MGDNLPVTIRAAFALLKVVPRDVVAVTFRADVIKMLARSLVLRP